MNIPSSLSFFTIYSLEKLPKSDVIACISHFDIFIHNKQILFYDHDK